MLKNPVSTTAIIIMFLSPIGSGQALSFSVARLTVGPTIRSLSVITVTEASAMVFFPAFVNRSVAMAEQ